PLALSSSSCSVRNESGLVRVAVGMSYLGLESKPYSLLRLPQSGLGLSKRCNRSLRRAQIVGGRDQNLQSANSRRNRNYVEQLNRFVHVHGEIALSRERGHSAANVTGKRLQFFHRHKLNLPFSRRSRQRFQVEFPIAGNHRHADSAAIFTAVFTAVA